MAIFCTLLFSMLFVYVTQKRRRRLLVLRGYQQRIAKLEERKKTATPDALLAIENQLSFLKKGYQEHCKKRFYKL